MKRITIASIQPPFCDQASRAANAYMVEKGFALLEEALEKNTAFCCLPEFFNVFGAPQNEMKDLACNHKALLERTCALAGQYGSYIILPMLVGERDRFFNRAYLVDPSGQPAGHYDKVHPTLAEREQLCVTAGDEIKIFATEHGRIATPICYDVYFPEFFSALTRLKPDILFFPSLQRSDHELASDALLRARAMDTRAYIVRSSYGRQADLPWKAGMMFGQSAIVHPDGTILANAGHYEGFSMAQIQVPFTWQRQRCGGYPAAPVGEFLDADRRPQVYDE